VRSVTRNSRFLRCQLDSAVTAKEQLLIEDLGLDSRKLVALAVGFGG
jgi:hypothetical protein